MGLKEQLMQDYKDAMKNADTVRKRNAPNSASTGFLPAIS